ncbi:MAG: PD40 domain-containing protein [Candidatus Eisenbacteria bacterium]|uniref:PD40 domain-containing protein n=1 Tax=Eiseniibacteriota bacterium TaxID=2212470 RepID=A0A938BKZ0_UNCEI|nr:PD40 domain-containing protein [Candidatus Eisenbacteria bacterium]
MVGLCIASGCGCGGLREGGGDPAALGIHHGELLPACAYSFDEQRQPYLLPRVVAADWGEAIKLGDPLGTMCPEDAVTIGRDGSVLYFYWSPAVEADPAELLRDTTGTYRAERKEGDPGRFGPPRFFELRRGARDGACDGRLSFTPSGDRVYFHSTRQENTGYQMSPPREDPLDIYVAEIVQGVPGAAVRLPEPINSPYLDGEHCLSPDGSRLYLSSTRPGGPGGIDLWVSTLQGSVWSDPVPMPPPINSAAADLQPAFAADDPHTLYFVSDRGGPGSIFRSRYDSAGGAWSEPEMVITGYVGEPSLVADGSLMYFVHVLVDDDGVFGSDIWYVQRR